MPPARYDYNLEWLILKLASKIDIVSISCEIALG